MLGLGLIIMQLYNYTNLDILSNIHGLVFGLSSLSYSGSLVFQVLLMKNLVFKICKNLVYY